MISDIERKVKTIYNTVQLWRLDKNEAMLIYDAKRKLDEGSFPHEDVAVEFAINKIYALLDLEPII